MESTSNSNGPLLELHMLGTGTSGCIPTIGCITHPGGGGCECCLSALKPEGKKNVRRNTSAMLRVKPKGENTNPRDVKSILIDCGKSFLTSALEWFPQKGFRKIDALIITHAHSDAMSGLDDLRGWTLGGAVQETMDIYVTAATFKEIERAYPYLVSADLATGGGDVPAMNYIIFDENRPFDCHGVTVTPLPVYHGIYFTKKAPYYSLGFIFNRSIAYISDVSYIPESTWQLLLGEVQHETGHVGKHTERTSKKAQHVIEDASAALTNGKTSGSNGHTHIQTPPSAEGTGPPVLVVDCLRVYPHTSHFGLAQAAATARRLKARRTYLTGFAHRVLHSTWESICEAIESGERPKNPPKVKTGGLQVHSKDLAFGAYSSHMQHSEVPDELKEIALRVLEEWEGGPQDPIWMRPTFDGHMIAVDEASATCWDDEYAKSAISVR